MAIRLIKHYLANTIASSEVCLFSNTTLYLYIFFCFESARVYKYYIAILLLIYGDEDGYKNIYIDYSVVIMVSDEARLNHYIYIYHIIWAKLQIAVVIFDVEK